MSEESYTAVAAQYASEEAAIADFDRIKDHFAEHGSHGHGAFDAAVINRGLDGKLSVVRREDGGRSHGARKGLAVGLASGLAVALFPAIAVGGALLVAGGAGAGIGAVAGHITRKTPSKDIEAISETLDAGSAGVILVLEHTDADEAEELLAGATKITTRTLEVDRDELDTDVDGAYE